MKDKKKIRLPDRRFELVKLNESTEVVKVEPFENNGVHPIYEYYDDDAIRSDDDPMNATKINRNSHSWVQQGNSFFITTKPNAETIPPGLYDIASSIQLGLYLERRGVVLDELFYIPDDTMKIILEDFKKFWASKQKYKDYGFTHKRGILMYGPPGSGKCHTKGTKILMYDGSIKNVEDIKEGELLMGDDNSPRKVLSLATGKEQCYDVIPNKYGDKFGVNESHILVLYMSPCKKGDKSEIIEMSVKEYLGKSNYFKHHAKLIRAKVDFNNTDPNIDPYFVGLWLGDGLWENTIIFVADEDEEIANYLYKYADSLSMDITLTRDDKCDKLRKFSLVKCSEDKKTNQNGGIKSTLKHTMSEFNLFTKDKIFPQSFLVSSVDFRKKILAGYIDADGHKNGNGCYDITSKRFESLKQIEFIARSLGYNTTFSDKHVVPCETSRAKCGNTEYDYYRLYISNAYDIPCLLPRKQSTEKKIKKHGNVEKFELKPLGIQEYYGFEIDGNHRYLLGDMTITHNTSLINMLIKFMVQEQGGIVLNMDDVNSFVSMAHNIRAMENKPILAIIEDLDGFLEYNSMKTFLNLLDGNLQIDNVVYFATTNYPERIQPRIINRPSRFDLVVNMDAPDQEARRYYLENKLREEDLVTFKNDISKWVADSEGMTYSHLKELIAAVVVMGNDYEFTMARLRLMNENKDDLKK